MFHGLYPLKQAGMDWVNEVLPFWIQGGFSVCLEAAFFFARVVECRGFTSLLRPFQGAAELETEALNYVTAYGALLG
jgi:hypothetical protein